RLVLEFNGDVLLDDRGERAQTAALADVRIFAERILRVEDVRARLEPGESRRAARARRLGLQPVEKSPAHALRFLQRLRLLRRLALDQRAVPIVVPRPVDHADVARESPGEVSMIDETPIRPEAAFRAGRALEHLVLEPARVLA